MTLQDERIQFFLRHRDDIRAWAAIEPEVEAAVRDLLAGAQPAIEERLLALDSTVITARRNGGGWERIMSRRPSWPDWRGVTLEWGERAVDPFGSAPPKLGFFWTGSVDGDPAKALFVERCQALGLETLGYRVPAGDAWPVLRRPEPSKDWWHDPEAWIQAIVGKLTELWVRVTPAADEAFSTTTDAPMK